jgi:hypothetical protein
MLERLLVADLDAAETRQMESHLTECAACRNRLRELKNEWRLLCEALDDFAEPFDGAHGVASAAFRKSLPWLITAALTVLTAMLWQHTRPKRNARPEAAGEVTYVAKEPETAWFFPDLHGAEPLAADFVPLQRVIITRSGTFHLGSGTAMTIETPAAFAVETIKATDDENRMRLRLFEGRFSFAVPADGKRLTLTCGDDIVRDLGTEFRITIKPTDGERAEAVKAKGAWNMERLARMSGGTWKTLVGITVLTGAVALYDQASGEEVKISPELGLLLKYDKDGDGVLSERERATMREELDGGKRRNEETERRETQDGEREKQREIKADETVRKDGEDENLGKDPRLPEGLIGFYGQLRGTVVKVMENGFWMKASEVGKVWPKSTAKNPQSILEQTVLINAQWTKEGGERWKPALAQALFIQSLQPGEMLTIEVANGEGQRLHILELTGEQRGRIKQARKKGEQGKEQREQEGREKKEKKEKRRDRENETLERSAGVVNDRF